MPNDSPKRCAFCTHRLNVAGDDETFAVVAHRVPPSRRRPDRGVVIACRLCAQAKGCLTEDEFRKAMGHPVLRKQWITLIHEAMRDEREEAS